MPITNRDKVFATFIFSFLLCCIITGFISIDLYLIIQILFFCIIFALILFDYSVPKFKKWLNKKIL